ncbi:guanine nucleotide-binding protein subunit gamma 3-like protein [Tanacetum coccineum]
MCRQPLPQPLSSPSAKLMIMALEEYGYQSRREIRLCEVMDGSTSNESYSSSMSPVSLSPNSSSSFVFVDLYGKRRQIAKVQVLEREIGLLQDEIKSLAELELASRCCKELEDYVEATPDPLVALNKPHGERLVRCYAVVAVVVVATQTYVAHAVRRQKTAVALTTKIKHVPQDAASVLRFHVVAAAIRRVLNVQFVAVVIHAHAFKCII